MEHSKEQIEQEVGDAKRLVSLNLPEWQRSLNEQLQQILVEAKVSPDILEYFDVHARKLQRKAEIAQEENRGMSVDS